MPSTLTVTNNLDGGRGGAGSLRAEIAAANPGDTINFAPSLDNQTITLANGPLQINKNLNIQGPGAGLLAIRPATLSNAYRYPRIFDVGAPSASNVTLNLSGLTLENGGGTERYSTYYGNSGFPTPSPWDGYGGAILNFGALTVSGCNLLNNSVLPGSTHVMYGGAIYNAGTLTLTGSTLSGNSACFYSASLYAGRGGAIYNAGSASISECTLAGNTAGYGYSSGEGGAIFSYGPLTLSACTLTGNTTGSRYSAGWGGGLYVAGGTVTLTNDAVQSDTAATAGGGIYIQSNAVVHLDAFTLANVINNTAPTDPNIDGSFLTP
ncbi:MAG TPA: hypothetical protein VGY66_28820 [Gemmataceae bacterium]|nr:hypothetical protein [Gemmataceae bacterium]